MRAVWVVVPFVLLGGACGGAPKPERATSPEPPAPVTKLAKMHPPRFEPRARENPLPRSLLFSDPERTAPRLSPDGTRIGFGGTSKGTGALLVASASNVEKAKPVNIRTPGQVHSWFFGYESNWFFYVMDRHGKEDYRAYAIALDTETEAIDLMPPGRVSADIAGVSPK